MFVFCSTEFLTQNEIMIFSILAIEAFCFYKSSYVIYLNNFNTIKQIKLKPR